MSCENHELRASAKSLTLDLYIAHIPNKFTELKHVQDFFYLNNSQDVFHFRITKRFFELKNFQEGVQFQTCPRSYANPEPKEVSPSSKI